MANGIDNVPKREIPTLSFCDPVNARVPVRGLTLLKSNAKKLLMNVALTPHFEDFIRQLIDTGRYNNASEVVRAALRELQQKEGEVFPPGSLKHLYTETENRAESKIARRIRKLV